MIKNLVFEGGGVKGIAYAGALRALEEEDFFSDTLTTGFGGTSAGAITAVLCAIGCDCFDIERELKALNFKDFMDDEFGVVRDAFRLVNSFGWNRGEFFTEWLTKVCKLYFENGKPTFRDIYEKGKKDLRLIGSNLSTGYSEVFSYRTTPDMSIVLAARISMSIPLFFQAVEYDGCVYVDGGLFRNYPIRIFDDDYLECQTLGLRLDSSQEIKKFKTGGVECDVQNIVGFEDYILALAKAIMSVQEDRHLHSDDWKRTVYIDTHNVSTIDFKLSDEKKEMLLEAGFDGAMNFINNLRKGE